MCRTINELEQVVADYRSLKSLKEELDEQVKDLEREIIGYLDSHDKLSETGRETRDLVFPPVNGGHWTANVWRKILEALQITNGSASTDGCM